MWFVALFLLGYLELQFIECQKMTGSPLCVDALLLDAAVESEDTIISAFSK